MTKLLNIVLCCLICTAAWSASSKSKYKAAHKAVKEAIKIGKKEPKWFKKTKVHWDMNRPWKEGRKEIRRLLEFNEPVKTYEAMKIMYLYKPKEWDKVKGEWGEYPFLGGLREMALVHLLHSIPQIKNHEPTFLKRCLASVYASYGAYDKAMDTLEEALKKVKTGHKNNDKWDIPRMAWINEDMGDLLIKMGEPDKAKEKFRTAAKLYPTSKQPYGREKLKPSADRCMRKIDRIDLNNLSKANLKDGTYHARQQAYSGVLNLQVVIKGNKIASCKVTAHKEKIHQGSITSIPKAIVDQQTVEVDAIVGATVTTDAIKDCAFVCLKQAGL